ncbi:hypothetical protein NL676_027208 [Syzygium grande]|nr:hypothetical protein NL676_027208 [Syzygium grande]
MEELRTLDLCESGIRDAPEGLKRSVNLRSFDSNGSELRKLPLGVLPKLAHLQYLNLGSKLYAEGREMAPIGSMDGYNKIVRLSCIAQGWQWEERLLLPREVELLIIERFVEDDLRSLMNIPSFHQVTNMKNCMIGKVKSTECVVPLPMDFPSHRYTALRSLEFLRLHSLEDLRVLVEVEENFAAASAFPRTLPKGNTFWGFRLVSASLEMGNHHLSYHSSAGSHNLRWIEIKYNDMGWWKLVEWGTISGRSSSLSLMSSIGLANETLVARSYSFSATYRGHVPELDGWRGSMPESITSNINTP